MCFRFRRTGICHFKLLSAFPSMPRYSNYQLRCHFSSFISPHIGVWRSLVAHLVRDEGVAGSNPATPTSIKPRRGSLAKTLKAFTHFLNRVLILFKRHFADFIRIHLLETIELRCRELFLRMKPSPSVLRSKEKRCAFSPRCADAATMTLLQTNPRTTETLIIALHVQTFRVQALANIVGSNAQADQWRFWMLNFHTTLNSNMALWTGCPAHSPRHCK